MGLKPFGFSGGRQDIYHPELDTYWGPETTMLSDERHEKVGSIDHPLGASEMGLIYVNPEGPNNNPDPKKAAHEIRATFGNMAMNDYETVALVVGGHTFGKSHGAAPDSHLGALPEGAPLEMQGFGYASDYASGKGKDTITSGIEGAWTYAPTKWDHNYLENLFMYDWKCVVGPGGRHQWEPADGKEACPDAHEKGKFNKVMMQATDIALKEDPDYLPIAKHFRENPDELADAFIKAWYKLLHRDMGPVERLIGKEVPPPQKWQDPIPKCDHPLIDETDIENLKGLILGSASSGLVKKLLGGKTSTPSLSALVRAAWASASTFRATDYRGGANGARIRLRPQKNWAVNDPDELLSVLKHYETIKSNFDDAQLAGKKVSLADLIVLGGCAAIEKAADLAGHRNVSVPFTPGRMDASLEGTDVDSFKYLEPKADGFRNYFTKEATRFKKSNMKAEEVLVDRAQMLTLTVPEMTVLIGGLRALNANTSGSNVGVLTNNPGTLTNDFFLNLLTMDTEWKPVDPENEQSTLYKGFDRVTGKEKWKASRVDLVVGSPSELRAVAEYYATDDASPIFLKDFIAAWTKVMNLDRFDLKSKKSSGVVSKLQM